MYICSICRCTFRCTTAHQCSSERAWINTRTECSNHYSSGGLYIGFYPSTFLGPVTWPRNSIWDWVLILNLELRINYLCIPDTIKRDSCDFQIFTLSKYSSVVINTVLVLNFTLKYEQYACPQTPPTVRGILMSFRYKKLNLSKKTDLISSAWINPWYNVYIYLAKVKTVCWR